MGKDAPDMASGSATHAVYTPYINVYMKLKNYRFQHHHRRNAMNKIKRVRTGCWTCKKRYVDKFPALAPRNCR